VEHPSHGTVTVASDGSFSYQHDGSDEDSDKFVYRVTNDDGVYSDTTVNISIEPSFLAAQNFNSLAVQSADAINETVESETEILETVQPTDEQASSPELIQKAEADLIDTKSTQEETGFNNVALAVIPQVLSQSIVNDGHPVLRDISQNIEVTKHKKVKTVEYEANRIVISQSTFEIVLEIATGTERITTDNKFFLDGLTELGKDLEFADEENKRRLELGRDAGLGVSLSVSAGVLAWVLRGGSLLGSMLAATPIWSQVDPLRVVSRDSKSENLDNNDRVEELFDR